MRYNKYDELSPERGFAIGDAISRFPGNVLWYGPPGTGKSYAARRAGGIAESLVFPVIMHSDLPAAELRGHYVMGKDGMRWTDGPAIRAWRNGGRLIVDEIDKAGDDALSFLLAIGDNKETARLVLGATDEIVVPHPDFSFHATMNGEPDDLPDALRDRFAVKIRINGPHPDAIALLSPDLRGLAMNLCACEDDERRVGLRQFLAFDRLRKDLPEEDVAEVVFGPNVWHSMLESIRLARHADQDI